MRLVQLCHREFHGKSCIVEIFLLRTVVVKMCRVLSSAALTGLVQTGKDRSSSCPQQHSLRKQRTMVSTR